MSQHTKGPWTIGWGSGAIVSDHVDADASPEIARMRATCVTGRWEADAHLIAAAPDLLHELREAHEIIRELGLFVANNAPAGSQVMLVDIRLDEREAAIAKAAFAAIKKAEGK